MIRSISLKAKLETDTQPCDKTISSLSNKHLSWQFKYLNLKKNIVLFDKLLIINEQLDLDMLMNSLTDSPVFE